MTNNLQRKSKKMLKLGDIFCVFLKPLKSEIFFCAFIFSKIYLYKLYLRSRIQFQVISSYIIKSSQTFNSFISSLLKINRSENIIEENS